MSDGSTSGTGTTIPPPAVTPDQSLDTATAAAVAAAGPLPPPLPFPQPLDGTGASLPTFNEPPASNHSSHGGSAGSAAGGASAATNDVAPPIFAEPSPTAALASAALTAATAPLPLTRATTADVQLSDLNSFVMAGSNDHTHAHAHAHAHVPPPTSMRRAVSATTPAVSHLQIPPATPSIISVVAPSPLLQSFAATNRPPLSQPHHSHSHSHSNSHAASIAPTPTAAASGHHTTRSIAGLPPPHPHSTAPPSPLGRSLISGAAAAVPATTIPSAAAAASTPVAAHPAVAPTPSSRAHRSMWTALFSPPPPPPAPSSVPHRSPLIATAPPPLAHAITIASPPQPAAVELPNYTADASMGSVESQSVPPTPSAAAANALALEALAALSGGDLTNAAIAAATTGLAKRNLAGVTGGGTVRPGMLPRSVSGSATPSGHDRKHSQFVLDSSAAVDVPLTPPRDHLVSIDPALIGAGKRPGITKAVYRPGGASDVVPPPAIVVTGADSDAVGYGSLTEPTAGISGGGGDRSPHSQIGRRTALPQLVPTRTTSGGTRVAVPSTPAFMKSAPAIAGGGLGALSLLAGGGIPVVGASTVAPGVSAGGSPFTIDELFMRKNFMCKLLRSLHRFGAPTHHTEEAMAFAAEGLSLTAGFGVLPTLVFASFGDAERDSTRNDTLIFRQTQTQHCEKLFLVDDLAMMVGERTITLDEADVRLNDIIAMPPRYDPWVKVLMYPISSACSAIGLFGGGWWDVLLSAIFGLVVGLVSLLADKYKNFGKLQNIASTTLVSFLAYVIMRTWLEPAGIDLCFYGVVLSSVVWLLSGMSLTTGVIEMANGSQVAGTTRIFGAVLNTLMIGFGVSLGMRMAWWIPSELVGVQPCTSWVAANGRGWVVLFFLGVTIPFNVLLDAHPRQWLAMSMSAGLGVLVSSIATLSLGLNGDTTSVVASFSVGVMGGLHSWATDHPPIINILNGVLMLVPGGLGVKGAAAFLTGTAVDGVTFGLNMLIIGLCISVGLFIAKVVVPFRQTQTRFTLW